jgi:hypothetical protein
MARALIKSVDLSVVVHQVSLALDAKAISMNVFQIHAQMLAQ